MNMLKTWGTKGFTLIEVIMTITIVAIVGAMLFSVLGTSMIKSSVPISRLQTSFSLQQIMENITADYPKNYVFDLPGLSDAVGNVGSHNNSYGNYTVVENQFIKFVNQTETSGNATDNLLKVTIKNDNNDTLTKIFVQ